MAIRCSISTTRSPPNTPCTTTATTAATPSHASQRRDSVAHSVAARASVSIPTLAPSSR